MSNSNSQNVVAFVRHKDAPKLPPPAGETGLIHWLRTRMFTTWYDSLGTLFIVYLLWTFLPPLADWIYFSAVFDATSSLDCKEKNTGACWAMIVQRFGQNIYGFIDPDVRWRIDLGTILFVVGLIPVLFGSRRVRGIAARVLIFGYPLIAFDLFFGGIVLSTISSSDFGGLSLTLMLAILGISLSLPLGIVLALGRISKLPFIRVLCIIFIETIRSVPLITILFMAQFMLPFFLPKGMHIDNLLRVVIGLVFFSSAYMAEVIRGGLQAIPTGQYEAAKAMGLNYFQSTRLIIMPQVLRMVLPGIVNLFIGIFKDSTLVSIIGMFDLLLIVSNATVDHNWLGLELEAYIFVGFVFFIFCFGMSRYSIYLEKSFKTGHE